MNKIPEISKEACIGCGQCASVCIQKCLVMEEGSPSYTGKGCMECGHCILICPADAICLRGDTPEDYKSFEKDEFKISPDLLTGFMKTRRSIRFFTDEPVSDEDLATLTEAGRYAPTSQNAQAVRYTIIRSEMDRFSDLIWKGYRIYTDSLKSTDPERYEKLRKRSDAYDKDRKDDRLLFGAKAAILISAKNNIDGGIASAYMELMAHSLGLGALYSGYSIYSIKIMEKEAQWLGIGEYAPVACLLLGHPRVEFKKIPVKNPADIVYR